MRYDIRRIYQACLDLGLAAQSVSDQSIEINLGHGAVLLFQNDDQDEDCLMGFQDTPWHTHDDLMFADARGNYVELNYLDLLRALREGLVLICELRTDGILVDRSLIHSEYNDEFRFLRQGDQVSVRRAVPR